MRTALGVCLIGYGEVGQTLASDLLARGITDICAWDIQFENPESRPRRSIDGSSVRRAASPADGAHDATLVISAVTAAQDLSAAQSIAGHLEPGAYFMDVNSVSPAERTRVADVIEGNAARYVEAAIMSPIAPHGIASPILLGGPHATDFHPMARSLGFTGAKPFAKEIGRASAAKMCRSVIVKGMEALVAESLLSARHYGVEDTVLESLRNLLQTESWPTLARYMILRSLQHGRRRAEEMHGAAATVREAGIAPSMSTGAIAWYEWATDRSDAAECEELVAILDRLLQSRTGSGPAC